MTQAKYFPEELIDPYHLSSDLRSYQPSRQISALKTILMLMTINYDIAFFFSDVAGLLSTSNIQIKRLAFIYLSSASRLKPELAMLHAGDFLRATLQNSPLVRGLALQSMSSTLILTFVDLLWPQIIRCLEDESPFVRRIAIFAALKFIRLEKHSTRRSKLYNLLIPLFSDKNIIVKSSVALFFTEIGNLTKQPFFYSTMRLHILILCESLRGASSWSAYYLIEAIGAVFNFSNIFNTLPEAEKLIEHILPFCRSTDSTPQLSAIGLILKFYARFCSKNSSLPAIEKKQLTLTYLPLVKQTLLGLLNHPMASIRFVTLINIHLLSCSFIGQVLDFPISSFFLLYHDFSFISLKKLDILANLTTSENGKSVLDQLQSYLVYYQGDVLSKIIKTICILAIRSPELTNSCVDILSSLLDDSMLSTVEEAVIALKHILFHHPTKYNHLVPLLCTRYSELKSQGAKQCIIWILGKYVNYFQNPIELLSIFKDLKEESISTQLLILTSVIQIFLKTGSKLTRGEIDTLGYFFLFSLQSFSTDLRERALFYLRLLRFDRNELQYIVFPSKQSSKVSFFDPSPVSENSIIYLNSLEAIEKFNLLFFDPMPISGRLSSSGLGKSDVFADKNYQFTILQNSCTAFSSRMDSTMNNIPLMEDPLLVNQQFSSSHPLSIANQISERGLNSPPNNPGILSQPLVGSSTPPISYFSNPFILNAESANTPSSSNCIEVTNQLDLKDASSITSKQASHSMNFPTKSSEVIGLNSRIGLEATMAWGLHEEQLKLYISFRLVSQRFEKGYLKIIMLQMNENHLGINLANPFQPITIYPGKEKIVMLNILFSQNRELCASVQVAIQLESLEEFVLQPPSIPLKYVLKPTIHCDAIHVISLIKFLPVSWMFSSSLLDIHVDSQVLNSDILQSHSFSLVYTHNIFESSMYIYFIYAEIVSDLDLILEVVISDQQIMMIQVRCLDDLIACEAGQYFLHLIKV